MKRIRVVNVNEINVQFDMIDDGLPESGEYRLIPIGKEYEFVTNYLKTMYDEVFKVHRLEFRLAQTEQTIKLLLEKMKKTEVA